jgi:hypothetical protein
VRATTTGALLFVLGRALPGVASASDGALEISGACAVTGCVALESGNRGTRVTNETMRKLNIHVWCAED